MVGDPDEVNIKVDDACNESASANVVNVSIMINGVILVANDYFVNYFTNCKGLTMFANLKLTIPI